MGKVGAPLDAAVARVWGISGRPAGTAFLAEADHLITAAHVLNLALGRDPAAVTRPEQTVEVDFPLLAPGRRVPARIVHWVPPVPGGGGPDDVAGLRLLRSGPMGVAPVPLARVEHPFDRRVVMLGFPAVHDDGVYSVGRLRGLQASGWVQIDVEDASQFTIVSGFSGAPVWDVDAVAAVGMVVAAWRGNVRTGYMIPAAKLFEAWPRLTELTRPATPFPGLRAFREQDAASFFGRSELTDRLDTLTRAAPVVAVLGPSGVGKSSLVHAGLLPRLRARPGTVVALARPAEAGTPLRSLALALDRARRPASGEPVSRVNAVSALADLLRRGYLTEIVSDLLHRAAADRLVLVVDQFEEVFAGSSAAELAEFGSVLTCALDDRSRFGVVAALRADFLGEALRRPALAPLVADQWLVTVAEPTRAELREVITKPVEGLPSVDYEPGLADRLLGDVGASSGRLPLLQFALAELWDRQKAGRLTHDAYDEIGEVDQALARHAEEVWAGLVPGQRQAAQRLLVQLVRPVPEGPSFTRRAARRSELDAAAWAVAGRLATARLLTLREPEQTGPTGEPVFSAELAHDSLITHWARLAGLVERHRDFRLWQEGLRQRMREWEAAGRPVGRLPGRPDLQAAAGWSRTYGDHLSQAEQSYLQAGRARRRGVLLRTTAAAVALVLVAGFVYVARDRDLAANAADDLAAKSDITHPAAAADLYGKVLLALRGYRTTDTEASAAAVVSAAKLATVADAVLPDYSISLSDPRGSVSADGRVLATITAENHPAAWRIEGGAVRRIPLAGVGAPGTTRSRAVVGAPGTIAAYAGTTFGALRESDPRTACTPTDLTRIQTCVVAYDLRTGQVVFEQPIPGALDRTPSVSIDASEQVLGATVPDTDGQWRLLRWNLRTGQALRTVSLPGRWEEVAGLWLAPGGEAATVLEVPLEGPNRRGGVLSVLDLTSPSPRAAVLFDAAAGGRDVAVSADGRRVAALIAPENAGDPVAVIRVWEVPSARLVTQVETPSERSDLLLSISLDPSGTQLSHSWLPSPQLPTDLDSERAAEILQESSGTRLASWSVPDGQLVGPVLRLPSNAFVARPLGPGEDAPIELLSGNLLALLLPNARGQPAARLINAPTVQSDAAAGYAALCDRLLDRTESAELVRQRPQGAYDGDVCS